MSKLDECVDNKSLFKISAGEVCSIETAKQLGIFDDKEYYQEGYDMIKTFDSTIDNSENRNSFSLCSYNSFKKKAFPHCPVSAGVNYISKPADPSKCIAVECPPNFEMDEEQTKCIKPVLKKVVPLSSKNDERWYDWFTIPNYHLYNRYGSSNNINFAPCPDNMLPNFETDPVDNVRAEQDITGEQGVSRCISKDIYYGGKYTDSSDFCPISWVKRAGSTKQDIQNDFVKVLETADSSGKSDTQTPEMISLQKNAPKDADNIIKMINNQFSRKENVINMLNPSQEVKIACVPLNTQERLLDTYEICSRLKQDEEGFRQKLISINGDTPNLAALKTKITKYNCYELFSGNESKASSIDRENLEFEDIAKIDFEAELNEYEKTVKEQNKIGPTITSDPEKKKLVELLTIRSINWLKTLAIIVVVVIIYFVLRVYLRKFIECILKPFLNWITFRKFFKYNQCALVDAKIAEEKVMAQAATRD